MIKRVDAIYPNEALLAKEEGQVVLLVTVKQDGTVGEVDIFHSAGIALDTAATIAMKRWEFIPAKRGGQSFKSRIKVPFNFSLPQVMNTVQNEPKKTKPIILSSKATLPSSNKENKTTVDIASKSAPEKNKATPANIEKNSKEVPIEVTVQGQRKLRTEERSISDFVVTSEVLKASAKSEGAEVLRAAPGLYIGRGEGPAVAHHYMLRGFDAEHGQDIEFKVGGLPINLPSHIHGQGYSDLGFLQGDTVHELKVSEGVYDPRQGDFAVAGSINLNLAVEERGIKLQSAYGAFNTYRQNLLWAPVGLGKESFAAVQILNTDGYGQSRAAQSGSAVLQHRFGSGRHTQRVLLLANTARAGLAGVLRQEDIEAGTVCFLCAYPDPSAQAQNALANRLMVGWFNDYQGANGENGQLGLWLSYDVFRIQNNFTGYIQHSRLLERVAGRGDLIEQQNHTTSMGMTGRYRAAPLVLESLGLATLEVGTDIRFDRIEQSQNLIDASVRSQIWDRRVDAHLDSVDLGVWGDIDWHVFSSLKLRVGLRADTLSYAVEDLLSNLPPLSRPQDQFLPGYRRSAMGLAWGPRTSLEWLINSSTSILIAYGEGYRSPQARTLEDGETAPFSKVKSVDAGLKFKKGNILEFSLGAYATRLSDDVAFEAAEGRLERIGATQRVGSVLHLLSKPTQYLLGSFSVTYVDATLLEPPPTSAEDPQPSFEKGQNLPFVPPLVVRADIGFRYPFNALVAQKPVVLHLGFGGSYLSARPLPFGAFSDPVSLIDLSSKLELGPWLLSFEIFNALNSQYASVEYYFTSDWQANDGFRSRVPSRHIAAGSPLSWLLSASFQY